MIGGNDPQCTNFLRYLACCEKLLGARRGNLQTERIVQESMPLVMSALILSSNMDHSQIGDTAIVPEIREYGLSSTCLTST